MTSFESIISKLAPTEIYSLEEGSNVYNEISAYSIALDSHRKNIDKTLRECFISSAEDYGLANREKVIGDVRTDYSLNDRRKMLILRKSMDENDFTLAGFERFLTSIGVYDYKIDEIYELNEIVINIFGSYSPADEAWITNQIYLMAPVHLMCNVYLGGVKWKVLDVQNYTFKELDSNNYTWTEFNSLG